MEYNTVHNWLSQAQVHGDRLLLGVDASCFVPNGGCQPLLYDESFGLPLKSHPCGPFALGEVTDEIDETDQNFFRETDNVFRLPCV
jgi:hypothetical protein